MNGEPVLDLSNGTPQSPAVFRASDPVISPDYSTPGDFAAQYPTPLDPTELLAMCEEITVWQALPEERTSLKQHTWREMTSLGYTSGSSYIFFTDGYCPEEYEHDGENTTITLKNIGAKKSLSYSDIMHSRAVAAANWHGINEMVGGFPAGQGLPGASDVATFQRQFLADVKAKEIRLGSTLVLNGWDYYLIQGSTTTSALQFTGIENWATVQSCTMHTNSNTASGTFSGIAFDRFVAEGCAKPTHVLGHPAAIQELMAAYFQLGFQGSQVVNINDGNRLVPGYNFAGFVNTGIGRLTVIADTNFTRTDIGGGNFQSKLYAFRMTHNGEPLVYKITQIPLSVVDLNPGCTAISFEIWAKTALIIKMCCAQGVYTSQFTGRTSYNECTNIY